MRCDLTRKKGQGDVSISTSTEFGSYDLIDNGRSRDVASLERSSRSPTRNLLVVRVSWASPGRQWLGQAVQPSREVKSPERPPPHHNQDTILRD